ncbi:right-handed parallel beta-helix repeat-containing protein [Halobacterium zhouii]|uniref:right-handed parallel beta-helix repeat-containing protein n=1 Tax=Halobacterium zhouii TaxID=2902624 RepID=UPI001E59F248|nr:right-handed parallel beta-helix repeat-containing protein [Halobacterium zhouii]
MNDRRRFLQAAALSLPFLAGCSTPWDGERSETDDRPTSPGTGDGPDGTSGPGPTVSERFDHVYDVVEEGIDPTGETRIDESVEELAGDDTLLYFPEGQYSVGSVVIQDVQNFGMVGDGATFDIAEKGKNIYLSLRRVADVHVEGFTVDNSGKNEAAAVDLKCTGGTNRLRNYAVEGFVDVHQRTFGFTLMVEGEDTSLELENVDLSKGARNAGGAFVFPQRDFYDPDRAAGSLAIRDCVMKGWGKEGLYASAHSGPLRIVGGEYANNAIAQVRIGGGNAPTDAIVRDVTVRVTGIPEYMPPRNRLLRGIWLKEGDGAVIENCTIEAHNLTHSETQGAVVVNGQFGRVTIRDCDITSSVPRPGIVAEAPEEEYDATWMPSLDRLPAEWHVTVENTTITGGLSDVEAVDVVGRDGCAFRNVTIDQPESGADGIRLERLASCTVTDSTIDAQRFPLLVTVPESTDDCLVRLDGVTLRGGGPAGADQPLASTRDGTFCVDASLVSGSDPGPGQLFGLSRTAADAPDGGAANGTSASSGPTADHRSDGAVQFLYGQLVDD